jgi:hypothetical protein
MTNSRATSGSTAELLEGLPGADLVARGLADLAEGKPTAEAALVEVARTRIQALGLTMGGRTIGDEDAELVLYARLGESHPVGDPYGLYCAWLDQLVSFLSALRSRRARLARRA